MSHEIVGEPKNRVAQLRKSDGLILKNDRRLIGKISGLLLDEIANIKGHL
jgi:hypothetical protein